MRCRWSVGTSTTASAPRPMTLAAFCTLKWLSAVAKIRRRASVAASGAVGSLSARHAWPRASSSACRFDCVPPLVKMPSASAPKPMRRAVQSISLRSIRVPPALWSHVSSEELTDDTSTSAASAGMTTGQLRWAR